MGAMLILTGDVNLMNVADPTVPFARIGRLGQIEGLPIVIHVYVPSLSHRSVGSVPLLA